MAARVVVATSVVTVVRRLVVLVVVAAVGAAVGAAVAAALTDVLALGRRGAAAFCTCVAANAVALPKVVRVSPAASARSTAAERMSTLDRVRGGMRVGQHAPRRGA